MISEKLDKALVAVWVTIAVVVILGVFATGGAAGSYCATRAYGTDLDWPVFLDALETVEAPRTVQAGVEAIAREGAYGPLQIRQACLTDVNIKYGTNMTLEEVAKSRGLSRWVCVHYIRMYCKPMTYQSAAKTWNGGPHGPRSRLTEEYWWRVAAELYSRGIEP